MWLEHAIRELALLFRHELLVQGVLHQKLGYFLLSVDLGIPVGRLL